MTEPRFADRALQDAYRQLMRQATGAGHLDDAAWDQLASGSVDQLRREELFDHVVSCEQCAQIWKGISALEQQATAEGLMPAIPTARRSWRGFGVPLALAAALVLAIGSVVLYRQGPESRGIDGTVNRGTEVQEVSRATYTAATKGFSWAPVDGASQYRVSVFTNDGQPVWTTTMSSPTAAWPDGVAATPGSYTWRVEALAGAAVIARSRLINVDIAR